MIPFAFIGGALLTVVVILALAVIGALALLRRL